MASYYGPELMHYGVMGMKWGVRRYQPYPKGYSGDGKYVPSEKERRQFAREIKKQSGRVARRARATGQYFEQSKQAWKSISDSDVLKRAVDSERQTFVDYRKARDTYEKERHALAKKYKIEAPDDDMDAADYLDPQVLTDKERTRLQSLDAQWQKTYDSALDASKKVADACLGAYGDMQITDPSYAKWRSGTTLLQKLNPIYTEMGRWEFSKTSSRDYVERIVRGEYVYEGGEGINRLMRDKG